MNSKSYNNRKLPCISPTSVEIVKDCTPFWALPSISCVPTWKGTHLFAGTMLKDGTFENGYRGKRRYLFFNGSGRSELPAQPDKETSSHRLSSVVMFLLRKLDILRECCPTMAMILTQMITKPHCYVLLQMGTRLWRSCCLAMALILPRKMFFET